MAKIEVHDAIFMINDKKRNLKKIIDSGCYWESFQLLGLHIDFLGKLLHRIKPESSAEWCKDTPDADKCFKNALQLQTLKKYNSDILRDNLRNGMIHNEYPKTGLTLTDSFIQNLNNNNCTINIFNLYEDFCGACDEVLNKLQELENKEPGCLKNNPKYPHYKVKVGK